MQVEGRATGAKTNPGKSLNCFCSLLGFLSLVSPVPPISPADLHFGKEERTVLRGHYIFSFQNLDWKCMVSERFQLSSERNLPGFPSCLGHHHPPQLSLRTDFEFLPLPSSLLLSRKHEGSLPHMASDIHLTDGCMQSPYSKAPLLKKQREL